MYQRIDFTNLGGYPLAQEDLDWMQKSFRDAFAAIADLIGDKVIISGVVEAAGSVSAGWISLGGELVPFQAGAISVDNKYIIDETTTALVFHDGSNNGVLISRIARFSAGGPYDYNDLVRTGTIKSFKAAFDALVAAYNVHTHAWADITGKPAGYITYVGSQAIGDISSDKIVTITIPDQGGTNYMIAGSLRGLNSNPDQDNDVMWIVSIVDATHFKVAIREVNPVVQNLVFDYAIIKTL